MIIKMIVDEDFVNYKQPAMLIAFPYCDWKCGQQICQNSDIANQPDININVKKIINRYLNNSITSAIICGGLEPFNSGEELIELIHEFRKETNDDIIIQTGYTEEELENYPDKTNDTANSIINTYSKLKQYNNIIVKFGRFISDQEPHYDEVLGIKLASNNQYAKIISKE